MPSSSQPEVVDDDLGALAGQLEGVGPADAAPGPGDDDDASFADADHADSMAGSDGPSETGAGAMRYGITMFATDVSIDVVELAREAEARGLESLWLPEHTHIPVSRRTPPPTGDAELAEEYRRCLDPLVALAAAAAATERLRLGTGILLAAQREPIVTAKAVATLDHLSGGRAALGVGFGWNEDELEHHGVAMRDRRDVARERMLAMQALWADDEASFHGEHVQLRAVVVVAEARAERPRSPGPAYGGAAGPEAVRTTSPSTATAGSRSAAPACTDADPAAARGGGRRPAATRRRSRSSRSARSPTPASSTTSSASA